MKAVDGKPRIYIDFDKENNKEGPKFKVCDHVRISKYKNYFAKVCFLNRSEEDCVIKTVLKKILCHGHILLMILTLNKFLKRFLKSNYKKAN